jgi:hypothetical protein
VIARGSFSLLFSALPTRRMGRRATPARIGRAATLVINPLEAYRPETTKEES